MFTAIFWMAVGAIISAIGSHLYHNKNFQTAMKEERATWEQKVRDARKDLKNRL